jgi:hypothetical protein
MSQEIAVKSHGNMHQNMHQMKLRTGAPEAFQATIEGSSDIARIIWIRKKSTALRGSKEPSNPEIKLPQPSFARPTRASGA